jgi:hypothetical protein
MAIFLILPSAGMVFSSDGESPCGYEMEVVPVGALTSDPGFGFENVSEGPAILEAWTTNDPYANPYTEVYDFTYGQDTLAFVVEYDHTGGFLPQQWAAGWTCGTDQLVKICRFDWTIGYLPPGTYLLINYFDPVMFKGTYDWASKVGDVVFGWPDIDASRPECFTVDD